MPRERPWFSVQLALIGSPVKAMQALVADLQEELEMRPHLEHPRVAWDEQEQQVLVEVDREGLDARDASDLTAEEVFEATTAVLGEFECCRVDALAAHPRDD